MPEVIAAIEANWLGSKELAFTLIRKAKEAGCDKVKMQFYKAEHVKSSRYYEVLAASILDYDKAREFKDYSEKVGVEWFATPMYLEAVEVLEKLDVRVYKIREKDSNNKPLIDRVLATRKPVYISTQIKPLDNFLMFHPSIEWIRCFPEYPMGQQALRELALTDFEVWDGYSNHSPSIYPPIMALARGAKMVEVHVTSEKGRKCPDEAVSLSFHELKQVCEYRDFMENIS